MKYNRKQVSQAGLVVGRALQGACSINASAQERRLKVRSASAGVYSGLKSIAFSNDPMRS
jgi:hypothetical protein